MNRFISYWRTDSFQPISLKKEMPAWSLISTFSASMELKPLTSKQYDINEVAIFLFLYLGETAN
jgi:hypothetical protein